MNFYKHFIGDYARDTGHLTLVEHGAYRTLLDAYYANARPLAADLGTLYRIAKAQTAAERRAVDAVVEQFFPVGEDGLRHNNRADIEVARHAAQVAVNREVGKRGGRPRKTESVTEEKPNRLQEENRIASSTETDSVSPQKPIHKPIHKPNGNPSHSQSQKNQKTSDADASVGASALPDCPHEEIVALYHALLPTCPRVREWTDARRATLRARWREKSRPNGSGAGYATVEAGIEWWRQFLGYAAQSAFLTGRAPASTGRSRPFVADLEWLLKPGNFAKVIEGRYHDLGEGGS